MSLPSKTSCTLIRLGEVAFDGTRVKRSNSRYRTLSGFTTSQTLKVQVTAINADDAEGPPSDEHQPIVP